MAHIRLLFIAPLAKKVFVFGGGLSPFSRGRRISCLSAKCRNPFRRFWRAPRPKQSSSRSRKIKPKGQLHCRQPLLISGSPVILLLAFYSNLPVICLVQSCIGPSNTSLPILFRIWCTNVAL